MGRRVDSSPEFLSKPAKFEVRGWISGAGLSTTSASRHRPGGAMLADLAGLARMAAFGFPPGLSTPRSARLMDPSCANTGNIIDNMIMFD